ncbi:pentapeptide repeat-containing protein [Enhygromyxa salina]|uniref:pentapeptide repeat-containing protein n=1 Tax=Enhygromyxa salina TaxID=215803 RepID=UPI0011BA6A9E
MHHGIYPRAIFVNCVFARCDLSRATFSGATFRNCRFDRTTWPSPFGDVSPPGLTEGTDLLVGLNWARDPSRPLI